MASVHLPTCMQTRLFRQKSTRKFINKLLLHVPIKKAAAANDNYSVAFYYDVVFFSFEERIPFTSAQIENNKSEQKQSTHSHTQTYSSEFIRWVRRRRQLILLDA